VREDLASASPPLDRRALSTFGPSTRQRPGSTVLNLRVDSGRSAPPASPPAWRRRHPAPPEEYPHPGRLRRRRRNRRRSDAVAQRGKAGHPGAPSGAGVRQDGGRAVVERYDRRSKRVAPEEVHQTSGPSHRVLQLQKMVRALEIKILGLAEPLVEQLPALETKRGTVRSDHGEYGLGEFAGKLVAKGPVPQGRDLRAEEGIKRWPQLG
jgi:hypothetical protein